MSINLVTYANQTVTPTNDAIIYERAIDQNGIFHGCNVTVSGNEVHITGGYGMVCGREFVIESEVIPVTLAPSGTNDGRLYVRLDLADADAPIQLLTAQGNPLPALEQDTDVNYVNGAYEMELATFTVGVSALSDAVETFETIVGSKSEFNTPISVSVEVANPLGMEEAQNTSKAYKVGNYYVIFCHVVVKYLGPRNARLPMFRFVKDGKALTPIAPTLLLGQSENTSTSFNHIYHSNGWWCNPVAMASGNMFVYTEGVFLAEETAI